MQDSGEMGVTPKNCFNAVRQRVNKSQKCTQKKARNSKYQKPWSKGTHSSEGQYDEGQGETETTYSQVNEGEVARDNTAEDNVT